MELCTNCNTKEDLDLGWCYSCIFWKEISDKIASGSDVKKITDDYQVYHYEEFVPNPAHGHVLGHSGRVWRIVQADKVLITNNLWCNGVVPEAWRNDPNLQPNCKLEQGDISVTEIEQHIGHYRCSDCRKFVKDGEVCRSKHDTDDLIKEFPF